MARSKDSSKTKKSPKPPRQRGKFAERIDQFKTLYQNARKQNPRVPWYLLGTFLVGLVVFIVIGLVWGHPIYFTILGVFFGALLALVVFGRLAERSAYASLEGQPGATSAAMGALRKGWRYEQEPVAADGGRARSMSEINQAAMVFRAVGKPGVVLIGEGPKGATTRLLNSESKRIARVAGPEVPVHTLRVGEGEDTVRVAKLVKTMNKLDKKLTDAEVTAVTKRLRALGAAKPPIPKGYDPRNAPRMDRKAMRGR
ncbi:DUF4191 domain-containing protein [Leekyejoonella antrihumi]|uniref:DUF4191 domain-containing protein n=1 Tax=Leekyejoonella antrihumi TaxID=1660198 RepID=A0A563E591_9MICO|nr:DUF4191 domain-containing protein [Leekyejoonella antrihumi]TWP37044.1 DUF4191 domain-containing protein [Leekyejoonella antrihumi]